LECTIILHTTLNDVWNFVSWPKIWNIREQAFEKHQNIVDIHVITMQENFCKIQIFGGENG
jgi:hypothetical protein